MCLATIRPQSCIPWPPSTASALSRCTPSRVVKAAQLHPWWKTSASLLVSRTLALRWGFLNAWQTSHDQFGHSDETVQLPSSMTKNRTSSCPVSKALINISLWVLTGRWILRRFHAQSSSASIKAQKSYSHPNSQKWEFNGLRCKLQIDNYKNECSSLACIYSNNNYCCRKWHWFCEVLNSGPPLQFKSTSGFFIDMWCCRPMAPGISEIQLKLW